MNTNKWKQHVPTNRIRIYPNARDAFYKHTDGSFTRAVNHFGKGIMMRRCDEQGQIIPRVRMSKKHRLLIRRFTRVAS